MGNKSNILPQLLPQFTQQPQKSTPTLKYLIHKKTSQVLLLRQIQIHDNHHLKQLTTILTNLHQNKSSFVTQLVHWEYIDVGNFSCSNGKIVMLFNNIGKTLSEVLSHVDQNVWICEDDIVCLLESVLKGVKYYKQTQHQHHQITLFSIFTNFQKTVLIDPFLVPDKANSALAPADFLYKSPEKQMYESDHIQMYDETKSLLYEVGLMILDIETKFQLRKIYQQVWKQYKKQERKGMVLKREEISSKIRIQIGKLLEKVQNFKLRSKLSILLNPDPQKRSVIFNILLPQKLTLSQFNIRKNQKCQIGQHRRLITQKTQLSSQKKSQRSLSKSPSKIPRCLQPAQIQLQSQTRPSSPQIHKNQKYFSYQGTPQSRSIQKPSRMNTSSMQQHHSSQTSFTYAQMLRTPTETSNYFSSKKDSPVGMFRQSASQWPFHNRGGMSARSRDRYQKQRIELQRLHLKIKSKKQQGQALQLPTISSVSNLHQASYVSEKNNSPMPLLSPLPYPMSSAIKISQFSLQKQNQNLTRITGTSTDNNASMQKSPQKNITTLPHKNKVPPLNIALIAQTYENSKRKSKVSDGQEQQNIKYETAQKEKQVSQDQEKLSPDAEFLVQKLGKLFSFQKSRSNSSHKLSPPTPSFSRLHNGFQFSNSKSKQQNENQNNHINNEQDAGFKRKTMQSVQQQLTQQNEQNTQLSYIKVDQQKQQTQIKILPFPQISVSVEQSSSASFSRQPPSQPQFITQSHSNNMLEPHYLSQEDRQKIISQGLKIIADAQKRKQRKLNQEKNKVKNQSKIALQAKQTQSIIFENGNEGKSSQNGTQNRNGAKNQVKFGGAGYERQILGNKFGGFAGLFPREAESIKNCNSKSQQFQGSPRPFPPPPSLQTLRTLHSQHSVVSTNKHPSVSHSFPASASIPSLPSSIFYQHFPLPFSVQSQKSVHSYPQVYQGQTLNKQKNGKGTFYYQNGFVYQGQWKNDKQHGMGKIYKRESETGFDWKSLTKEPNMFQFIGNGVWQNGKMIKQIHLSTLTIQNSHTLISSAQKLQPSIANLVPPSSSMSSSAIPFNSSQKNQQQQGQTHSQNLPQRTPRMNRFNFHYTNATSVNIQNQIKRNTSNNKNHGNVSSFPNVNFSLGNFNGNVSNVSRNSIQKNRQNSRYGSVHKSIDNKANIRRV